MLDAFYKRRLERDLQSWRQNGWVSPEAAQAILDTVKVDGAPRTAIVVGFLGAVLIAAAAMAFVAANWSDMARPARLVVLVGGMTVCYGAAALLVRARHPWFADAAVFAGAALFGAAIMLVAQSYHISGDYPDALLMWGAGAFLAAVLGPSRAALLLSIMVFAIWHWYEVFDFGWVVHWPALVALALIAAVAGAWSWRPGIHVTVLALIGWCAIAIGSLADAYSWSAPSTVAGALSTALVLLAAGNFLRSLDHWPKSGRFGPVLFTYGLFAFLGVMILLQAAVFDAAAPDLREDRLALVAAAVMLVAAAVFMVAAFRGKDTLLSDGAPPVAVAALSVGLVLAAAGSDGFANSLVLQVLLSVLVLAACLWAVAYGNRVGSRSASTFGLLGFAAEVLYLYFVTIGTLLDTAVLFLTGGILLIGLAAVLIRLQRRLAPASGGEAA